MPNFAAVRDGIVHNIIFANSLEDAIAASENFQVVELEENQRVDIGGTYDGVNFTLIPRPLPEDPDA